MALVLKDRVKQAAAAPGTGTITLGATATGFQSFASVGNGNTTYFAIVDPVSGDWEVNYGVYTSSGTTLTRNATPLSSSAGGALINFTGAVDVFLTYPSSKAVWQDVSGLVAQQSFGAITATSAALTTGTITTAPVNNTDIVNKEYADAIASGIHFHEAVALATTAALPANTYNNGTSGVGATLTGNTNGALSVDSTLTIAAERILVKNEVAGANNGVYVVTQVGSAGTPYILTRATDFDSVGTGVDQIDEGDFFLVTSGTANVNTAWVQQTPPPITIGTTPIVFQQFSAPITYTAGTGLSESPSYTFNIANTGTAGTYGSASAVPVFVTNAQGQVTSVTNTAIAINGSAVTGNISGSAGSVANALTLGTYLTGGTYNGSGAVTATVDATSANTASKVVARDASGNFSAGTITATFSGNTTSATNIAGGAANQVVYQSGSGTTAFATAPSASNQVFNWNGSAFTWSAGTISGVPLGSNLNSLTAGTYLTGTAYNGSGAQTWTVDATSANTASKVVARDASGNFSAGTITAALTGNVTGNVSGTSGSISGFNNPTTAATANTIVYRDSGGDIYQRYGFAVHFNQSSSNTENPTIAAFWTNSAADGYNRKSSPAHVISQLGLLTTSNYNSYAPTLTGTGASGTWGINITGSAGSAGSSSSVSATTSTGIQTSYTAALNTATPGTAAYGMVFSNQSTSNYAAGLTWAYSGTASQAGIYVTTSGGYGTRMYIGTTDSFATGVQTAISIEENGVVNTTRNYFQATSSARAPIFYDSNNTAYYLDPNSNTSIRTVGSWRADSSTWDGEFSGKIQYHSNHWYIQAADLLIFRSSGGSNVFQVNQSGSAIAIGDSRAPIFYDYNDTSYYVNPNSSSYLYSLVLSGAAYFRPNSWIQMDGSYGMYWPNTNGAHLEGNTLSSYGSIAIRGNRNGWAGIYDYYSGVNMMFDNGSNGGFYRESTGRWYLYHSYSNDCTGFGTSTTNSAYNIYCPKGIYSGGRVDGTIFYDANNTAYYADLAGTSNVNQINLQGILRRNTSAAGYLEGNYPTSIDSSSSAAIYTIGGAYQPTSLTLGNMYGIGYTLGNAASMGFVADWGLYVAAGGVARIFLDSGGGVGYATGSWRAPIFYDSNNTAYYVDPASTTVLNALTVGGQPVTGGGGTQAFVAFGSTGGF